MNVDNDEGLERLRAQIIQSLRDQGFEIASGRLSPADAADKEKIRSLHERAVRHRINKARPGLERHEDRLLDYIAKGTQVVPDAVHPRLVLVQPGSEDELLFRYARLHWSVPVSAGYGRRLRFVVYDESNGKLIGVFGLGDPVFSLGPRDRWIGWSPEIKRKRLQNVMDLFVLGAVPPYSQLLCGKLVALLATSLEVQDAFKQRYAGKETYIRREPMDGRLALLTTISALGRSSLYNRLTYHGQTVFQSVGFTQGSGEFHFSNGLYEKLRKLAEMHADPTAKHESWGKGFRNKRELLRKALPLVGLSRGLIYHGVRREIFLAPLGANAEAFLRGEDSELETLGRNVGDLFAWFRKRWLLPRAARTDKYRDFDPENYRIWGSN